MKETMGQIIKRLRKEQDLTQEDLAEHLNISAQAISKWENDTSMPDISQILPLANLFGVPTDVLFGVCGVNHDMEVRTRLEEIFRMCDNCADGEEAATALIIFDKYREAMRLYPNNSTVLVNAMAFAEMVLSANGAELKKMIGQEGIDNLTQEIIRWAKLVIKFGTSADDVLSAKYRLMNIYARRGSLDEAYEIADSFPGDISDTRGIRLAELNNYTGESIKERQQRCRNIQELSEKLGQQAALLGDLYFKERQYNDALYCYSFLKDMVDSLYRDEKYRPPFMFEYYHLFHSPAICLIKLDRNDDAITLLEKGAQFIIDQSEHFNKKKKLNVPLLKDCIFGYGYDGTAEYSDVNIKLKNFVCSDDFKSLSDNPRYQVLLSKIDL